MTFNKAFKDVANFSTLHKAKKTGVAKQDLARKHLRESMGSEKNALSTFQGSFDIICIFLFRFYSEF